MSGYLAEVCPNCGHKGFYLRKKRGGYVCNNPDCGYILKFDSPERFKMDLKDATLKRLQEESQKESQKKLNIDLGFLMPEKKERVYTYVHITPHKMHPELPDVPDFIKEAEEYAQKEHAKQKKKEEERMRRFKAKYGKTGVRLGALIERAKRHREKQEKEKKKEE